MKIYLPTTLLLIGVLATGVAMAQPALAPDQNPNYAISRAKYMQVADSLNEWHSTTFQDTYKAIDWLADRKEARADRREFRRQLRMESIRWDNYYNGFDYYPSYRGQYYNNYYHNGYRRYNNNYYNRFGNGRGRWGIGLNYFWP